MTVPKVSATIIVHQRDGVEISETGKSGPNLIMCLPWVQVDVIEDREVMLEAVLANAAAT